MTMLPDLLTILAGLGIAAAVAALTLGVIEAWQAVSRRYLATVAGVAPVEPEKNASSSLTAVRRTLIAVLAGLNSGWVPKSRLESIEKRLQRAGKPAEITAPEFVALVEVGAACGVLFTVPVALWLELGPGAMLFGLILGATYPMLWLRDKIKHRTHLMIRALPYNLDLLTLSVEAGLDFAAALAKVVDKGRKGPLADELNLTLKELKLGKTREEALRNLAVRVEISSITQFTQALIQPDKMGTSLGKVLRILSTQMRIERTQRAEKLANEAPVKLLLPLIGFIFPTIFFMLFGPIIHSVFFAGE